MKKNVFLLAALAVALFTSCKDDTSQEIESGAPATIELTLQGTGAGTKATGTPASENVITNVVVGVFKCVGTTPSDSDPVEVIVNPTLNASNKATITSTAGPHSVVVMANVPTADVTSFTGAGTILTRGAFLAKTALLSNAIDGKLPMSGVTGKFDFKGAAEAPVGGNVVSVTLSR